MVNNQRVQIAFFSDPANAGLRAGYVLAGVHVGSQ